MFYTIQILTDSSFTHSDTSIPSRRFTPLRDSRRLDLQLSTPPRRLTLAPSLPPVSPRRLGIWATLMFYTASFIHNEPPRDRQVSYATSLRLPEELRAKTVKGRKEGTIRNSWKNGENFLKLLTIWLKY